MDKRQIFIHQAVVRRAHSEYIIAKNGVYASLLVIAMAFTASDSATFWTLIAIGVIANISVASYFRRAEKKMKTAEQKLLALQTEAIQEPVE